MNIKSTLTLALAGLLSGVTIAQAGIATFATVPVTGCPTCTAIDPSNLKVEAIGHQVYGYPTGWDVWTSAAEHLVVVNGIGADFTLPNTTFDLTRLKLLGLSIRTKTVVPLTYNLIAYHPNNPIPDIVPFTIPATSFIGKTYFIETEFTPH